MTHAAWMAIAGLVAAIAVLLLAPGAAAIAPGASPGTSPDGDRPAVVALDTRHPSVSVDTVQPRDRAAVDIAGAQAAIELFQTRALACLAESNDGTDCVWNSVGDLLWSLDEVLPEQFGDYDEDLDGFWDDDFGFDDFWGDFGEGLDGSWDDDFGFDELGEVLATYQVTNGALVGADGPQEHQAIWARFTDLIPSASRGMVAEFEVFTDGRDGILAAVGPLDQDPTEWVISIDPADAVDPEELAATLIHEFAHLLTLNNEQIPALAVDLWPSAYDQAAAACVTYFTYEGCSRADSYVNLFVVQFWDGSGATGGGSENFVTEYAMTDPAEDMAKTFMIFVLEDRPSETDIASQKVLFFYEYQELVSLRDAIRGAL